MFSSDFWKGRGEWKKEKEKKNEKKKIFPRRHGWLKTGLRTCHMSQAISRCKREEALWPAFGVRDIGFHARSCSFKPDGATSSPHCTSHHHPTAFTALGAHATAVARDGGRLAQCESITPLRTAVQGRLRIPRSRNGERATLWGDKHVRGQARGGLTDLPKR